MSELESQKIEAEERALDAIHAALDGDGKKMTLTELAVATGLARGYLQGVLKKSECVLKCGRDRKWRADWSDVEERFRPVPVAVKNN